MNDVKAKIADARDHDERDDEDEDEEDPPRPRKRLSHSAEEDIAHLRRYFKDKRGPISVKAFAAFERLVKNSIFASEQARVEPVDNVMGVIASKGKIIGHVRDITIATIPAPAPAHCGPAITDFKAIRANMKKLGMD